MSLSKRVELLIDPKDYADLEEVARSRGASVGALIRQAVKDHYLQPASEEKRKAARHIITQGTDFGSWEEVKATIVRGVDKLVETP